MLVCNKCGNVIPEPEEEVTEEAKEETSERRSRFKKEKPQEETLMRRPSLIRLPYKYGVNCYERKDFDLCDVCKTLLEKQLDKVKYLFIQPEEEQSENRRKK